ncbi:MAG: DUF4278 domain-containing protein [Spirulinaceae cyanobacterium RM2_2_10]|nr:DUF4278 domain-containing protein [Spirulinaceae cyanobacterium SM2_1_0]NJO21196.1 DUF4278 domain-containing protein [Spirulinaceae cyanobacterium RM2_2_10]
MKMTYRGIQYEREPFSLEVQESELVGTYRGCRYHYRYPQHVPQLRPKPPLLYRGNSYQSCPLIQTEVALRSQLVAIAQACQTTATHEPELQMAAAVRTHRENLRQNLARRLAVARSQGNADLIQALERESQQLAHH